MGKFDQKSPFQGFAKVTPPMTKEHADNPPPPWPSMGDPRTDACLHDWDYNWGQEGECQHFCLGCKRWIWERAIWPQAKETVE